MPSWRRGDKEPEHQLGGSERLSLVRMNRLWLCGPIVQTWLKDSKSVAATERFITFKSKSGLPILVSALEGRGWCILQSLD